MTTYGKRKTIVDDTGSAVVNLIIKALSEFKLNHYCQVVETTGACLATVTGSILENYALAGADTFKYTPYIEGVAQTPITLTSTLGAVVNPPGITAALVAAELQALDTAAGGYLDITDDGAGHVVLTMDRGGEQNSFTIGADVDSTLNLVLGFTAANNYAGVSGYGPLTLMMPYDILVEDIILVNRQNNAIVNADTDILFTSSTSGYYATFTEHYGMRGFNGSNIAAKAVGSIKDLTPDAQSGNLPFLIPAGSLFRVNLANAETASRTFGFKFIFNLVPEIVTRNPNVSMSTQYFASVPRI